MTQMSYHNFADCYDLIIHLQYAREFMDHVLSKVVPMAPFMPPSLYCLRSVCGSREPKQLLIDMTQSLVWKLYYVVWVIIAIVYYFVYPLSS
ncbi:MAG: hypothetical protein Tsb0013_00480 [Phycisphaerales bacterium]